MELLLVGCVRTDREVKLDNVDGEMIIGCCNGRSRKPRVADYDGKRKEKSPRTEKD